MSLCVSTAATPGKARAADASMDLMRACATGLCMIFPISMPRISRSSVNAGLPSASLAASSFGTDLPTTWSPPAGLATTTTGGASVRVRVSVPPEGSGPGSSSVRGAPGVKSSAMGVPSSGPGSSSPRSRAAAFRTAATGFTYPVQRHSTPDSASRASASVIGCGSGPP